MILFFGLGPFAATLHADDDSSLPTCCRRHGAHHCSDSTRMASLIVPAHGASSVSAPSGCPYFPGYNVAASRAALGLTAALIGIPALPARRHTPAAARAAARFSDLRPRADRGPPSIQLA